MFWFGLSGLPFYQMTRFKGCKKFNKFFNLSHEVDAHMGLLL